MEFHGYLWNNMVLREKSIRLCSTETFHSHENKKYGFIYHKVNFVTPSDKNI